MFNNPIVRDIEANAIEFIYPLIEEIKLERPASFPQTNFWQVIRNRRSSRIFERLSLDIIATVLYESAKVKNLYVQENGYILTERSSASAGGRHPIDIIICTPSLENSKFLYYYNPFTHALNKLNLPAEQVTEFYDHVQSVIRVGEGTIFWFVAHPQRTAAKYDNSQSLVWRDSGALGQCIQIVCEGLGLRSCVVGSLGEPYVSNFFKTNGTVFGAGGIIIG